MIDLALLAGGWTVSQSQRTLGLTPTQVLPANPRRFAVIFTYLNNPSPPDAQENFAFLTINSNPLLFGVVLTALRPQHFDYQKFAIYVQQPFFARDSGT